MYVSQDKTEARLPLSDKWQLREPRPLEQNGLKVGDVVQKGKQIGKVYQYNGGLRVKWNSNGKIHSESLNEKWGKTSNPEAGSVDPGLLTLGLDKTIKQDVTPAIKSGIQFLKDAYDGIKQTLFAGDRGETSKSAAASMRSGTGNGARAFDVATHALKDARKFVSRQPIEDNYDLIKQVEGGDISNLPKYQQEITKTAAFA
jgi:hypothetical protein